MKKIINHILAPLLIGVFVISFTQNPAHVGGGYLLNLLENNKGIETNVMTDIIPYSEIPCDNIYKEWDIHNIHAYKFQRSKMRDTVSLVMGYEPCDFQLPSKGVITSKFGKRDAGYHYGIDIKLRTGNQVTAAFEGMVRISQYSSSYGNVVVLRHNNGLETLYAHLSKRKVKPGDYVQTGEVIGLGGNTGRSRGSHLHFETRYQGEPINPEKIIDFNTGELENDTIFLTKYNFASKKNVLKKKNTSKAKNISLEKERRKSKRKEKAPAMPSLSTQPTVTKPKSPKKSSVSKKKKAAPKTSGAKRYHKVKSGNTLYSLARENGVTVQQIRKWNKLKGNNIKVGTRIRVK